MIKKEISKSKSKAKVTFTLPKEATNGANEVMLLGEFNNWNVKEGIPMEATNNAYKAVVELTTGRNYEFRYLLDNKVWMNDWAADGYVPNPFGFDNSVVSVQEVSATMKKATAAKTTVAPKTTAKKVVKTTTPKAAKATPATSDKLTKIEGIGPKIETLLNNAGIVTFSDLAKATTKTMKTILTDAGSRYQMHDPSTWSRQAKMAAAGKWDELKKLQDELKGSRS